MIMMNHAAALALCAAAVLPGCTTAQIAQTEATVSKYQADVAAACSIAQAAAGSAAAMSGNKDVAAAAVLVAASCGTEQAVAALVLSPTSVAWLNTLSTTLKTGGKVVPPAPIENP